jgi:7-cyano-7-deazaguanine synthase in queuosine biosynthesis
VLLSGGLDSATVLAIARSQGYELYALSFSYGQRHVVELDAAQPRCRLDWRGGTIASRPSICVSSAAPR